MKQRVVRYLCVCLLLVVSASAWGKPSNLQLKRKAHLFMGSLHLKDPIAAKAQVSVLYSWAQARALGERVKRIRRLAPVVTSPKKRKRMASQLVSLLQFPNLKVQKTIVNTLEEQFPKLYLPLLLSYVAKRKTLLDQEGALTLLCRHKSLGVARNFLLRSLQEQPGSKEQWRIHSAIQVILTKANGPKLPVVRVFRSLLQKKKYPVTRIRYVLNLLGSLGPFARPATPEVLVLLKHSSSEVRNSAVRALGRIRVKNKVVVKALIKALRDKSYVVRLWAAWSLGQLGSAAASAVPTLLQDMRSKIFDHRSYILPALGRIGASASTVMPHLIQWLPYKYESTRGSSLDELDYYYDGLIKSCLKKGMVRTYDDRPLHRSALLGVIAYGAKSKQAISAIWKELKHAQYSRKRLLIRALVKIGRPSFQLAMKKLEQGSWKEKTWAVELLAQWGTPAAMKALKKASVSGRHSLSHFAKSLQRMGKKGLPMLWDMMFFVSDSEHYSVFKTLGKHRSFLLPRVKKEMSTAKDSQRVSVVLDLMKSLSDDGAAFVPFVLEAWGKKNLVNLRGAILETLGALGARGHQSLAQLFSQMNLKEQKQVLRGARYQVTHSSLVQAALRHSNPKIKKLGYALVGQAKYPMSQVVRKLLQHPKPSIRREVIEQLKYKYLVYQRHLGPILSLLKHKKVGPRLEALRLFAHWYRLAPRLNPHVLPLLKSKDKKVQHAVLHYLANVSKKEKSLLTSLHSSVPVLFSLLKQYVKRLDIQHKKWIRSNKREKRRSVFGGEGASSLEVDTGLLLTVRILGALGTSSLPAYKLLERLLLMPNRKLQSETVRAIGRLGKATPKTISLLLHVLKKPVPKPSPGMLSTSDPDAEKRGPSRAAAKAIGVLVSQQLGKLSSYRNVLVELVRYAGDPQNDRWIRAACLKALSRISRLLPSKGQVVPLFLCALSQDGGLEPAPKPSPSEQLFGFKRNTGPRKTLFWPVQHVAVDALRELGVFAYSARKVLCKLRLVVNRDLRYKIDKALRVMQDAEPPKARDIGSLLAAISSQSSCYIQ